MNYLSSSFVITAFQEITKNHSLWNHEFLVQCKAGQLTLSEVRSLAVQMYKFSKEFTRILASILSCCSDEQAQMVIMENLFDEMGRGNPQNAHPELFRHFTRALGIDDKTLEALPTTPETQAMIETYLNLPHRYGYIASLGTICFASEGIVSTLYSQLKNGIIGAVTFPKEALIFFDVHVNVDDEHAANLATLLEPHVTDIEDAMYVNRAIIEALDARMNFFNGVQRQAVESMWVNSEIMYAHG